MKIDDIKLGESYRIVDNTSKYNNVVVTAIKWGNDETVMIERFNVVDGVTTRFYIPARQLRKLEGDNWLIFEDRTSSLLARWKKFYEGYEGEKSMDEIAYLCIHGFLNEVNDDYTKGLLEGGKK